MQTKNYKIQKFNGTLHHQIAALYITQAFFLFIVIPAYPGAHKRNKRPRQPMKKRGCRGFIYLSIFKPTAVLR